MIKIIKEKIRSFLIFTQRFTRTDNIYLAKGGFWIISAGIVANILGIVMAIIFTRLSTKVVYGQYQFVLALIDTLLILSLPAINTAVMEAVVRGKEKSVLLAIKRRLQFGLTGSLIFLLIGVYFYVFKQMFLMAGALLAVAIFFPAYNIVNTVFAYYDAKKKFYLPQIIHILMRLIITASIVIAIIFWNNIFAIITIYLIANGVMNLVILWYFKKTEKLNGEADLDIVHYGLQLTFANIIPEILNNADKLFISVFLGVEALAIYIIAEKIPNSIKGFLKSLKILFFPKFVYLSKENFIAKFKNVYPFFIFVSGTILIIIALPWIIPLLFGSGYKDSIFIAQLCSLIILPFILYDIISDWFQAKKDIKKYFYIRNFFVIGSALLIVVFLFFYKSLISVIWARIIITWLAFIYGLYWVKKS